MIFQDLWTIIDEITYKKLAKNKIKKHNIKIEVEEKFQMLYIFYNNRHFVLRDYKTLNIILRSIIKGNDY